MFDKLRRNTIIGIVFTIIVGTLLHFTYELSGNNIFVGLFSAVNESTWEHLKLLFFPFILFSLVEYLLIGKRYNNYLFATASAVVLGMLAIITLFYTYTGIIGKNYFFVDILIYIIAVILTFYIRNKILLSGAFGSSTANFAGAVIILLLSICFIVFTIYPPRIAFFIDPITLTYGINKYL